MQSYEEYQYDANFGGKLVLYISYYTDLDFVICVLLSVDDTLRYDQISYVKHQNLCDL